MSFLPSLPRQEGFSLVEILLTLGLIASIAIGAFLVYPRLQTSQSVSDAERKFITILSTTREYFGEGSYSGLSNSMAVSSGIVAPADLASHWGGINLVPAGSSFRMDFLNVPKSACQSLVPRLESHSAAVQVGSTLVKDDTTTFNALTAAASCGDSQTVSFWPGNS